MHVYDIQVLTNDTLLAQDELSYSLLLLHLPPEQASKSPRRFEILQEISVDKDFYSFELSPFHTINRSGLRSVTAMLPSSCFTLQFSPGCKSFERKDSWVVIADSSSREIPTHFLCGTRRVACVAKNPFRTPEGFTKATLHVLPRHDISGNLIEAPKETFYTLDFGKTEYFEISNVVYDDWTGTALIIWNLPFGAPGF
jgi:hypothetical protein